MKRFSILLLFVCTFTVVDYGQTCISANAKTSVDKIRLIESLPIKKGEPFTDSVADEILKHGDCSSPFLVSKLSNNSPSKVSYLFQYKIGQVALILLNETHKPTSYPYPDGTCNIKSNFGDYRDFVEFFQSKRNRKKLKSSWAKHIKKNI